MGSAQSLCLTSPCTLQPLLSSSCFSAHSAAHAAVWARPSRHLPLNVGVLQRCDSQGLLRHPPSPLFVCPCNNLLKERRYELCSAWMAIPQQRSTLVMHGGDERLPPPTFASKKHEARSVRQRVHRHIPIVPLEAVSGMLRGNVGVALALTAFAFISRHQQWRAAGFLRAVFSFPCQDGTTHCVY